MAFIRNLKDALLELTQEEEVRLATDSNVASDHRSGADKENDDGQSIDNDLKAANATIVQLKREIQRLTDLHSKCQVLPTEDVGVDTSNDSPATVISTASFDHLPDRVVYPSMFFDEDTPDYDPDDDASLSSDEDLTRLEEINQELEEEMNEFRRNYEEFGQGLKEFMADTSTCVRHATRLETHLESLESTHAVELESLAGVEFLIFFVYAQELKERDDRITQLEDQLKNANLAASQNSQCSNCTKLKDDYAWLKEEYEHKCGHIHNLVSSIEQLGSVRAKLVAEESACDGLRNEVEMLRRQLKASQDECGILNLEVSSHREELQRVRIQCKELEERVMECHDDNRENVGDVTNVSLIKEYVASFFNSTPENKENAKQVLLKVLNIGDPAPVEPSKRAELQYLYAVRNIFAQRQTVGALPLQASTRSTDAAAHNAPVVRNDATEDAKYAEFRLKNFFSNPSTSTGASQ